MSATVRRTETEG